MSQQFLTLSELLAGRPMVRFPVALSAGERAALDRLAAARGISRSAIIREAVGTFI